MVPKLWDALRDWAVTQIKIGLFAFSDSSVVKNQVVNFGSTHMRKPLFVMGYIFTITVRNYHPSSVSHGEIPKRKGVACKNKRHRPTYHFWCNTLSKTFMLLWMNLIMCMCSRKWKHRYLSIANPIRPTRKASLLFVFLKTEYIKYYNIHAYHFRMLASEPHSLALASYVSTPYNSSFEVTFSMKIPSTCMAQLG